MKCSATEPGGAFSLGAPVEGAQVVCEQPQQLKKNKFDA